MKLSNNIPRSLNNKQTSISGEVDFKAHKKKLLFDFSGNEKLKEQWPEILTSAYDPQLEIIVLNNTELRSDVLEDNIEFNLPFSLPGKLLVFLMRRFSHFKGAADKGLVVLSIEQMQGKAENLEAIILELAHLNNLEPAFLDWIENANYFYDKKMFENNLLY